MMYVFVQISYPDAITLMEHLVNMGEGSASLNRQYAVGTDTFLAAAALYQGNMHFTLLLLITATSVKLTIR